jgi:hypothetical protein
MADIPKSRIPNGFITDYCKHSIAIKDGILVEILEVKPDAPEWLLNALRASELDEPPGVGFTLTFE